MLFDELMSEDYANKQLERLIRLREMEVCMIEGCSDSEESRRSSQNVPRLIILSNKVQDCLSDLKAKVHASTVYVFLLHTVLITVGTSFLRSFTFSMITCNTRRNCTEMLWCCLR